MLGRNWKLHDKAIMKVNSGALEDFSVVKEGDNFRAWFTSGPNLQDQRLCTAISDNPLGPFSQPVLSHPTRNHTRLYRNRLDEKRRIVSQVWPGLPKCGIWLHTDIDEINSYRELLIPPQEPFDIVAANPGIFVNPDGDIDIAWEGRSTEVLWSLYAGALHPDGTVSIDTQAICVGANPSYLLFEDTVYLYYSHWVGKGFETWVMTQKLNG